MQGIHRLGTPDRTLLWGTSALMLLTLGAAALTRSGGTPDAPVDNARLCYNAAGVASACLPSPATDDASSPAPVSPATASAAASAAASSPAAAAPATASAATVSPAPSRDLSTPAPPPVVKPPPARVPATPSPAVAAWTVGVKYSRGNEVTFQGHVYACVQAHTAQADWSPLDAPALWTRVS